MNILKFIRSGLMFWLLFAHTAYAIERCDVDKNSYIDREDIRLVTAARNTAAAGPDDPRDGNIDGRIDNRDVVLCTQRCTLTGCSSPPANNKPVANAGNDTTAIIGQQVQLSGAASYDSDGDLLSFHWRFISLPNGSGAILSDASVINPVFIIDRAGDYLLELVVNDGKVDSTPATIRVSTENSTPIANAGSDQTGVIGQLVTLDGTGSSDIDGNPLSYVWSILSIPAGSNATLNDINALQPTFSIDVGGSYQFQLIVNDGSVDSLPDSVTVTTENSPPVANAGPDQHPLVGAIVQLDGSASYDVDGNHLTYSWTFLSKPNSSNVAFVDSTTVQPSFEVDVFGTYIIQLIVNDGFVNSIPVTVRIDTQNSQPVANAGPDQKLDIGSVVLLDGSASYDVDGNSLSYNWSLLNVPVGSSAQLSNSSIVNPSFFLDLPGIYLAQLVVNDGTSNSTPDTVIISSNNIRPVANAGPDQTAVVGATLTLDGRNSSDADGDPLSFAWSISSKPTDSLATLTAPLAETTELTLDKPGSYVVQLIVNDGTLSSLPDTMLLTTENRPPVADAGAAQVAVTGQMVFFNGSNSVDPDGDTLSYHWSLVAAPQGSTAELDSSTTALAQLTPDLVGQYTLRLIVSDGELDSSPAFVDLIAESAQPELVLQLSSPRVGVGRAVMATVSLPEHAAAGGVNINLVSADTTIANPSTTTLLIAEGSSSAEFQLNGINSGNTTISASASGYQTRQAAIYVTSAVISLGDPGTLAPGSSNGIALSLSEPAPEGGVTIALSSSNPDVVTVSSSIFIAEGQSVASSNPVLTADRLGEAIIFASSELYAPDQRGVTVSLTMSFTPANISVAENSARAAQLNLSAPAPTGGLYVNLSTSDSSVADIPAQVWIPQGQLSAEVMVSGINMGNATIHATLAQDTEATLSVTVTPAPAINATEIIVGKDLQVGAAVWLDAPPSLPTTITISVADPTIALVSESEITAGSGSLSLSNITETYIPNLVIQGLQQGETSYTISAPGYKPVTRAIKVWPSSFVEWNYSASALNTTTFSNTTELSIRSSVLYPEDEANSSYWWNTPYTYQAVRGGLTLQVPVVSSNNSVGIINSSPLVFTGGQTVQSTHFTPLASGSTQVNIGQPAGFTSAASGGDGRYGSVINVNVTAPDLSLSHSGPVGKNLQDPRDVYLQSAPPVPTTVEVCSSNTAILLLSLVETESGSRCVTLDNVTGTYAGRIWVQGIDQGEAILSATADSYNAVSDSIAVWPSGFVEWYYSASSHNTTTFSSATLLSIQAVVLYPDYSGQNAFWWNTPYAIQAVRAGLTVQVPVLSSNTSVGIISNSPLVFTGGQSNQTTHFTPLASGSTQVNIGQPAGFSGAAPGGEGRYGSVVNINVTAPNLSLNHSGPVGKNLQDPRDIYLQSAPPVPTAVEVCSSDDSILLLSKVETESGSRCVTLDNVTGTYAGRIWLQAIEQGEAILSATADSYNPLSSAIAVWPSGFAEWHYSSGSLDTTTFSPNVNLTVFSVSLYPEGTGGSSVWWNTPYTVQAVRAGLVVEVPLSSSNSSVGVITNSSLTFTGGQTSQTTQFDPLSSGTTVITVTQPTGFSGIDPGGNGRRGNQVVVNVTAPTIYVNPLILGKDLINITSVSLQSAPPTPVSVQVCSTSTAVALLSKTADSAGSQCLTYDNVSTTTVGNLYVHGISQGSVQLRATAAGYNNANQTIDVWPTGFGFWNTNYSANVSNGSNNNVRIGAYVLHPTTLNYYSYLPLRPGVTVDVSFSSNDPAVGEQTEPLSYAIGPSGLDARFTAKQPGSVTLTMQTPAGFSTPTNYRFATMQVNP